MMLREYQVEFVSNCVKALEAWGNTLGVAPTGSGKTLMLSQLVKTLQGRKNGLKTCILAHRKELTEQNAEKFLRVNPSTEISFVTAESKDWRGQVTFAMVQTLASKHTLHSMPHLDLLVIDETHHVTARSYERIIARAKELNPNLMIFGVTATPNRSDRSNLCKVFSNCGDQIYLLDLIHEGFLVRPKTFVIDVAQERLKALKRKNAGDYSDGEVADILNSEIILEEVVRAWREKASDRKTVIFCSTIEHAKDVTTAFISAGIKAVLVTSEMSKCQRERALEDIADDKAQVLVNVSILTEGWDFPPISCVVLLRQSSHKSALIQMVGRGLRSVDSAIYPNVVKNDCVVLDFGISSILHGNLEDEVDLMPPRDKQKGVAPCKTCPKCEKIISGSSRECPFCGHEFGEEKTLLGEFSMKEIDMLNGSNLPWYNTSANLLFCSGFNVWSSIVRQDKQWFVVVGDNGKDSEEDTGVIYEGTKFKQAMKTAESFLTKNDNKYGINKEIAWRKEEASSKQINSLRREYRKDGLLKGEAATLLAYQFKAERELKRFGLIA